MNLKFPIPTLFFILMGMVSSGCVNDDDYGVPTLSCVETSLVKTKEVSQIPFLDQISQYTSDDVIEAYVTSSDEAGNFFKSISLQTLDGLLAFSVPTEATSTFVDFDPGRKVLIKMKNLYTDSKDGGMRIGGIYLENGLAEVGRLPVSQFKMAVVRSCTLVNEADLIQEVTLTQLQTNTNAYLNKLIEIKEVQFTDAALGKNYYDANTDLGGGTNHLITDKTGTEMIFRSSSYANFAHHPVPSGSGKVRGVLTRYGDDFQFMVRYESDVMLEQPRFTNVLPLFTEDFQTATDNTNLNISGWVNFAESGTKLWKEKLFQGNGYAEFSAYNNGNNLNVVWLVSPPIDLGNHLHKIIKFDVAQHHLDVDAPENDLQVLIATDFDGSNVLAATWTPIVFNKPVKETAWYEYLSSTIDVSSYTGTIYIAFKFKGSGTNTQLDGAFQVDNLKAYGFDN